MPDRLSAVDNTFLYLEEPTLAMHSGTVLVFETPEGGFGYHDLLALVASRIGYAQRYRQRVRQVPVGLGGPMWVDDDDFDLTYHVRQAVLPAPGTEEQLAEFVARVHQRLLDRDRPLWEMYLVEGLADDRFALVTKTHQAMVDGLTGLDLAQVILDDDPVDIVPIETEWQPEPAPSDSQLLFRAAWSTATSPRRWWDGLLGGLAEARHSGGKVVEVAGQAATTLVRTAASPAPSTPLNTVLGARRKCRFLELDLAAFQDVRKRRFGNTDHTRVTVNDVVLATITGALRSWLMMRGEPVTAGTTLRAMVPVSVVDDEIDWHVGGPVIAAFVDLPVGEPNPGMRLRQVSYRMAHQVQQGHAMSARGLAGLAGFAPSTLHSMAARLANAMSRRVFNVMISYVPGPQRPRFAGRARLVATYPVIPLARQHALSIGLTSYHSHVHLGLHADEDAMPDLDDLAESIHSALDELLDETA